MASGESYKTKSTVDNKELNNNFQNIWKKLNLTDERKLELFGKCPSSYIWCKTYRALQLKIDK